MAKSRQWLWLLTYMHATNSRREHVNGTREEVVA
jgi:hypothetical protein